MNRKRDLENIGLIYEGYAGIDPENIGVRTSSGIQKKAVRGLLRRGYEVHDEYTKKTGGGEIVLVKGENLIKNRNDSEEVVGVDAQGNINGQPYQSFLAGIEEDEQTSDFGEEMRKEKQDQNPLQDYEGEEVQYQVGDKVKVNAQRSLDDLRSGRYGTQDLYLHGVISHIDDDNVQIDTDQGTMEVSINDIVKKEEEAEDLGPNQQPESWGDEAMGSEKPGQTSQRFAQDPKRDPESGGSPHINDPNEQEEDNMDLEKAVKVINNYLKARVHGDESHASKEVRDAKKAYIKDFVKKRNHTKKESYNSHGDRDMTLLAENYLNIKHHE